MVDRTETGTLFVVATPIGNLEDLSPRAREAMARADLLVCEDTRRTATLCARFGVTTRRRSLHAHNETKRLPEMLEHLAHGAQLALVSDAGTPLLSDPGAALVRAAIERGHRVVPIPGPSAILAALVASGLPTRPFTFVGFLPRKGAERRRWLEWIARLPGSIVLFEAPTRVARTLDDLHGALGSRRVSLGRELTKRFESVTHGRLGELVPPSLRGEVTLVIEGTDLDDRFLDAQRPADPQTLEESEIDPFIEARLREGAHVRDLARELAARSSLTRRAAYQRILTRTA